MHGNMPDAVDEMRKVKTDEKVARCRGSGGRGREDANGETTDIGMYGEVEREPCAGVGVMRYIKTWP